MKRRRIDMDVWVIIILLAILAVLLAIVWDDGRG
jgi:hypothetical protein